MSVGLNKGFILTMRNLNDLVVSIKKIPPNSFILTMRNLNKSEALDKTRVKLSFILIMRNLNMYRTGGWLRITFVLY